MQPTGLQPMQKNTRLLIELADYEAETGDIAATTQYLNRLVELVDAPSELRLEQLDAVNRARVEIMVLSPASSTNEKRFPPPRSNGYKPSNSPTPSILPASVP